MQRRINWQNLPSEPKGFTHSDLVTAYKQLYKDLVDCKRMKGATEGYLRKSVAGEREAKQTAKRANKQLVTITKKQKAKEEAAKAGYWSGSSAICVALLYELMKASNAWPGGIQYKAFWSHEAMVTTLTFVFTALFGWLYRGIHPDSR